MTDTELAAHIARHCVATGLRPSAEQIEAMRRLHLPPPPRVPRDEAITVRPPALGGTRG